MPTFVYGDYEPREYPDLSAGQGGVKNPGDTVDVDSAPDFRWAEKTADKPKPAPAEPPAEPPASNPGS